MLRRIQKEGGAPAKREVLRLGNMAATRLSPNNSHDGSRKQVPGNQAGSAATDDPGDNPRTPAGKDGTRY